VAKRSHGVWWLCTSFHRQQSMLCVLTRCCATAFLS
jgi:hypothetical protein